MDRRNNPYAPGAGLQPPECSHAEADATPAAIVPVVSIGIQKVAEKTPLTVDASEVNPPAK
jgi:hypothetical protein